MKAALLILACAVSCRAQLPVAPQPHLDSFEKASLVVDAGFRGLDVYSTHWMLAQGNRELFLPGWIAQHPAVMTTYSAGMVAADYWAVNRLNRHHRKLARAVTILDSADLAPWAIHNLYLPQRKHVRGYGAARP